MNLIVPRTCTEIAPQDGDQYRENGSRPLKEFRSATAYVLLGDPGSGKTEAFKAECDALEENAYLTTAREFLTLNIDSHPEWRNKTLFIDGLDEIRGGAADARTPFDQVRRRLDTLGRPRFRLSCRDADWLGENDRRHLESVSQDAKVKVLRLNPLTDSDVIQVVADRLGNEDAEAFVTTARERGVDALLKNPQSLIMLAEVLAEGCGWPKSRLETFEKACSKMVREHNEEHELGGQQYTPDQLMDAAGRLCAVQLLSGTVGYSLRYNETDDDYPSIYTCNCGLRKMLGRVLDTKLFKSIPNNLFVPVHRHIAEFLGARHLAKIIGDGLPARRVLALITGEDGIVVTEMRGLSAWLAAHCSKARADLIERDPIGVGLYGDIREFSADEKHALLKALRREGYRLVPVFSEAAPFGALATPDMESVLNEILTSRCRSRDHQMLTEFVLRVLRQGDALPSLSRTLIEVVRDDTWWPRINMSALDAFIHLYDSEGKTSELKMLLSDIRAGSVSDPTNELLGTLLTRLYPQELPSSEVWDYLSETGDLKLIGTYRMFWHAKLIQKSPPEDLAELLDSFLERLPHLQSALDARRMRDLPVKLLAACLETHGDKLETERLYDWLSAGLYGLRLDPARDGSESSRQIRSWLTQRPEIQKKVIEEGLDRQPESKNFRAHAFDVQMRLYGADPPADLGVWCLKKAVALVDTKPQVAEHMLEEAVWAHRNRRGNEGLSLEVLEEHTCRNERLRTILDQLLSSQPTLQRYLEGGKQYTEEEKRQEVQWLEHIRANEAALRENRAVPALLNDLAQAYFGGFYDLDYDEGPNAIAKLLKGDHDLIDATLQGLRGVVQREDVPDIDEILDLRKKGLMHYLGDPFLAGLAEIERTAQQDPSRWDEGQIRKAIAFYYCTPHGNYRPQWYRRLIKARPEIVADVQTRFAVSEFRNDREHIYKLWELAHDPDHAQVARHASLPPLRSFPARCKLKQIEALDCLLWAALQHADRALLEELINKKISQTSLNVAQRVHWLAAGIIVSPAAYEDVLQDFVNDSETRTLHLAGFFCDSDKWLLLLNELGISGLEVLIRLIGRYVGSDQQWATARVTRKEKASGFVDNLIQHLAESPTQDASGALGSLLADTGLFRWRDVLSRAQDAQRVIRRDADYRHFNIEQVCQTLNGGTPANAADLAALVRDKLCDLAVKIQTGNTDDWRQYWNEDSYGRSCSPKHEDSCRNALLSDLRERLPDGVRAQPEEQYARKKRADIRVSFQSFQVPVEIKKNGHQDLWSAIENQLIKLYTIDPATDGYGIYLVFWFGRDYTQPPPSGPRPASPQKLQRKLEATLAEDQARKISVCVIDLSGDSNVRGT